MPNKIISKNDFKKILINMAIILAIFAISLIAARLVRDNEFVKNVVGDYGYPGLLIASAISGFNLIFPIPAISFLPVFLEAGLNFWGAIATITLGMTIGDTIGFFIGRTGSKIAVSSSHQQFVEKLHKMRDRNKRWPILFTLFYASFAPLPNELLIIPLGFMGYRYRQIAPPLLIGNTIFNILTAHGVIHILRLF